MHDRELEERLESALEEAKLTRRSLLRRGAVYGAGLTALPAIVAACGGGSSGGTTGGGTASVAVPASGQDISIAALTAAAKNEGTLNTIALPPDWANYGEIMSTFQSKYGIKINNANPNGSSAEENQAVVSLKGQSRAPDVLDVGPSFAADGKNKGLYANYKNSNWDTIPDNLKDAGGAWVGDYWGAVWPPTRRVGRAFALRPSTSSPCRRCPFRSLTISTTSTRWRRRRRWSSSCGGFRPFASTSGSLRTTRRPWRGSAPDSTGSRLRSSSRPFAASFSPRTRSWRGSTGSSSC